MDESLEKMSSAGLSPSDILVEELERDLSTLAFFELFLLLSAFKFTLGGSQVLLEMNYRTVVFFVVHRVHWDLSRLFRTGCGKRIEGFCWFDGLLGFLPLFGGACVE